MHSLKQGNFYITKKNGYQYLEKKSNSKLIEGFIEANTDLNTTWKMFENHMMKHEGAVGSEFAVEEYIYQKPSSSGPLGIICEIIFFVFASKETW